MPPRSKAAFLFLTSTCKTILAYKLIKRCIISKRRRFDDVNQTLTAATKNHHRQLIEKLSFIKTISSFTTLICFIESG